MMDGEIKRYVSLMSVKACAARLFLFYLFIYLCGNKKDNAMAALQMYVCLCVLCVYGNVCVCGCSDMKPCSPPPPLLGVESEPEQWYLAVFPQWKSVPGQKLQWKFPLME